ncbi:hypothetical protein CFOL_v3_32683 [Cephalotus follicularis]|uniref:DUF4283 domain-containing protein n=1 Tax=Cephalotus follicularis TaxID=3775 RepID=A0A1Q3DA07_CEPFO|nr:hypothetical protein CFOL_v3_32683 [Cephalotus follicularis]
MCFPGLPLPLHNPSILKAIGDSLGRYLRSDANTVKFKHPQTACICVEMDISAPPTPAFFVAIGELQIHQHIILESRCLYCSHCLLQGHCANSCWNRKRKHASVPTLSAVRSGKEHCGGLLPAGTVSPGPNNLFPTLPPEAFPTCLQGVCGNASVTPSLTN